VSVGPSIKYVVLGSRGSELAMFQARSVAWELQRHHVELSVKIQQIATSGDKILDAPLSRVGGVGLFVKELENALLAEDIDLAVHSCKDLPTDIPEGLEIVAYGLREDPRDVFIGKASSLEKLPLGAKIGTSSLRRRSQLLSLRPDLKLVDIRGNVDTRIRKIEELGLEGTILAAAGVKRLEREDEIGFYFSVDEMIPAVGQGVIAIETRQNDQSVRGLVSVHHHDESAVAVRAERALMNKLEGGCQVPIGAHATMDGSNLLLHAYLGSVDGTEFIRDSIEGPQAGAESLGLELAVRMYEAGGKKILDEVKKQSGG
jgi:hydroxymethylbilane synthase